MRFGVSKLRTFLPIIEVLHMKVVVLMISSIIEFETIVIHRLFRRHRFFSLALIRVFFKQGFSFYAYTIQYLQLGQVPQQIVNLFFLMEVYTQRFQIWSKRMQGINCLLYVLKRIAINIDFLQIGQHRKIARQLGQIVLCQVERLQILEST